MVQTFKTLQNKVKDYNFRFHHILRLYHVCHIQDWANVLKKIFTYII
jgi:hypothetical protein